MCPIHGEFSQNPSSHLNGCGCPRCSNQLSYGEEELSNYLINNNIPIILKDRSILEGLELDIYIPDYNFAIEFNGCYWHSDKFIKDKNYHLNKVLNCNKKGIKLLQIFEDEFYVNKDEFYNLINDSLDLNTNVSEIVIDGDARHLEAHGDSFTNGLIEFTLMNENINRWSLNSISGCNSVKIALIKQFIEIFKPNSVEFLIDFGLILDRNNNFLTACGFKEKTLIEPSHKIVKDNRKLWNCGFIEYIWSGS